VPFRSLPSPQVTTPGTGAIPNQGATVKAHYTGWLDDFDSTRKFDSSRDRGRPFTFKVGAGQVIRGWDEAFGTMKVGERRQVRPSEGRWVGWIEGSVGAKRQQKHFTAFLYN